MSSTYVIADLHGRFDLLEAAIERIAEHAKGSTATIITLGDYVDRGPQSRQIIEFLMDPKLPGNLTLVSLKGNHEDIMWQTCGQPALMDWWLTNGGGGTLVSYGQQYGEEANVQVVPIEHLRWINQLPLMFEDEYRVYVHAGVDPELSLGEQDPESLLWKLYQDDDERGYSDKHVVHGHQHFADGPRLKSGRTDLDTFAWYTGRLVVGVFNDRKAGGPIEFLEIAGPSYDLLVAVGLSHQKQYKVAGEAPQGCRRGRILPEPRVHFRQQEYGEGEH